MISIHLLKKGANVNARDINGVTALSRAYTSGNRVTVQVLKADRGTR